MWELYYKESWVLKNRCFWTVVLEKTLESVSWTARRSNQSILKVISPECSLEWLMLKVKLQYFDHLLWRVYLFEKTLMFGKVEGRRRRGQQGMRWLDGITNSMDMSVSKFWELVIWLQGLARCSPWGCKESDTNEWLSDWIEHLYKEAYANTCNKKVVTSVY